MAGERGDLLLRVAFVSLAYWLAGAAAFALAWSALSPAAILYGAVAFVLPTLTPLAFFVVRRASDDETLAAIALAGALLLFHVPADYVCVRLWAPELLGPGALLPAVLVYLQFAALPPLVSTIIVRRRRKLL